MYLNFNNRVKDSSNLIFKLGLLVILLLGILIFLVQNIETDYNEELYNKIESRNINTVITDKSIDYSNHGATYIVYGKDSLPTHIGWNEKIKIGDSIIKPKNSLILTIKNTSGIEKFNYEDYSDMILTTNF